MGEEKDNKSYYHFPIVMKALRIGWLFDDEGKEYLQALLATDDMDHFNTTTNIVMIEFLYLHFK